MSEGASRAVEPRRKALKQRGASRAVEPRKWWVWHPLLFAAWPVITLYGENVGHTLPRDALWTITVAVGVAAALTLVGSLALRDGRKAGLLTSLLVVSISLWGTARDGLGEPVWLLPTWLVVTAVIGVAIWFAPVLRELTTVATAMAVIVVGLALWPVVSVKGPELAAARALADESEDLDGEVGQWSADGPPRDIYYLIFDRYGSEAAMERRFGMQISDFFDGLEQRGFYVASDSKANHLRSAQSLSSSLNLRYHLGMTEHYGADTPNMLPIFQLLEDHAVGRLLQDRGYDYVHIGNWWDPTQDNPNADVNYPYERWSDFQQEYFRSVLLSKFERRATGWTAVEQRRRVPYDGALKQFADLRRAAERPGPTFTFAHILLPHEPFVFDRHGNYVDYHTEDDRTRELNYTEQTLYTNAQIHALLDDLLDVPADEQPIVVLQADEGPHPVRFKADEENFDWTRATDDELEEKFAILNAYLLPGEDEPPLYESISPVNTWRVIFNRYFGANFSLLEDRSYVFRDENHVYDFTEITDRLGGP